MFLELFGSMDLQNLFAKISRGISQGPVKQTQVRENATLRPEFFLLYDQILDYYVTNGLSQTEE
jgi:hypothetical protein